MKRSEAVMLFVGPRGSSDERVAALFDDVLAESVLPVLTINHLVSTVDMAPGTVGILPLEDDIRGEFYASYDAIVKTVKKSLIFRTVTLEEEITMQVLDPDKKVQVVYSHPDIITKYSSFLLESGIEAIAAANTSVACKEVEKKGNPFYGALAPSVVGQQSGLVSDPSYELEETVIRTRYGLLGQPEQRIESEQYASIIYFQPSEDRSGTLLEVLETFKEERINLRRLRSQNRGFDTPHGFFAELEGHIEDDNVMKAASKLVAAGVALKVLGVFPITENNLSPEKAVIPTGLIVNENDLPRFSAVR
jgi:prephenate dehydratase